MPLIINEWLYSWICPSCPSPSRCATGSLVAAGAWLCLLAASFPDCSGTGFLRWDMMGHFPWETPGSQKLGSALEMLQYVKVNKLM